MNQSEPNEIPYSATVVAADNQVSTGISDEVVILNSDTGKYHSLRGVAADIWSLIQEPTTVATVLDSLLQKYDIDPDTCGRDLTEFLSHLVTEGLVTIQDETPA